MKFTKTLLTTALFSLSVLSTTQMAYANSAQETQLQQGFEAAQRGDFATALQLWKPLAERGHAKAQYNLGVMYKNGQEVKQDDFQAVKWYQKAAEQGDAKAQYNLGNMYSTGRGVKQDDFQAVKWYQKAAEQGYASAQFNLALMYRLGRGVKQDRNLAKMWAGKACDNGNQIGCNLYRTLNEGK
ncbi:tetratricopeptide repeat protein [Avibacterium avium]|uniref:tetratricopeptide repeat protein n=1 Tax=Avibacterium avium TaxID=751 RepID=UPI003BF8042E